MISDSSAIRNRNANIMSLTIWLEIETSLCSVLTPIKISKLCYEQPGTTQSHKLYKFWQKYLLSLIVSALPRSPTMPSHQTPAWFRHYFAFANLSWRLFETVRCYHQVSFTLQRFDCQITYLLDEKAHSIGSSWTSGRRARRSCSGYWFPSWSH